MGNSNKPLRRSSNILEQDADGELLIYDLERNKALYLNKTVTKVYQLCDGRNTVASISDKLSVKLKELVSEEFVLVALDELDSHGLLEGGMPVRQTFFGGVSRREMIRRAGLTTMAALPVIAALTAPKAAHAQSGASACVGAPSCTQPIGECLDPCPVCVGASVRCSLSGGICPTIGPGSCLAFGTCDGNGNCSLSGGTGCTPGQPGGTCTAFGECIVTTGRCTAGTP